MLSERAEGQANNDITSMRISAGEKSDVCLAAVMRAYYIAAQLYADHKSHHVQTVR